MYCCNITQNENREFGGSKYTHNSMLYAQYLFITKFIFLCCLSPDIRFSVLCGGAVYFFQYFALFWRGHKNMRLLNLWMRRVDFLMKYMFYIHIYLMTRTVAHCIFGFSHGPRASTMIAMSMHCMMMGNDDDGINSIWYISSCQQRYHHQFTMPMNKLRAKPNRGASF